MLVCMENIAFRTMILKCLLVIVIVYSHYRVDCSISVTFPVGGLFNVDTYPTSAEVFCRTNKTNTYSVRYIQPTVKDIYSTALDVCAKTSNNQGVVALIDARPTYGICDTTCLLCNKLNISHLSVAWEPPNTLANNFFTFSYHPPPDIVSKAYATLIKDLGWDKFTILYESDDSFTRLQEVINTWPYDNPPILYRKLNPDGNNLETFKYIFKQARMNYHVIDAKVENIEKYMREILKVENSTRFQSFILTSLDSWTLDFRKIDELKSNISTLHITKYAEKWKDIGMGSAYMPLETALTADALSHLEKALRFLQGENDEEAEQFAQSVIQNGLEKLPSLCFHEDREEYDKYVWPMGEDLRRALINTKIRGFTGEVEFDEQGRRTNFVLYHSKLNLESLFKIVGKWDYKTDTISKETVVNDRSNVDVASNVLRVVSRVGSPYFEVDDSNDTIGYRGFAIDLINTIVDIINQENKEKNFHWKANYYRVEGDKYGNPIEGTKKWDGLIGELLEHNADLAICDLTITSERNKVVDFSTPFMSLGISMLFLKKEPEPPDMFSFINPLSLDVWLYLCTVYIIVSFILLICARMSQADWVNPHPCNQNPENLENIWTLYNCMWLTMGSIMTQGCDILPRAAGSRFLTGVWWFFALIITSSYTANMSTFLSNSRRTNEIQDVKMLSEQNRVSYGAVMNASTYKFFKTSNESVYQKIWSTMQSTKPSVFVSNNDEGKDRVLRSKGNFAFFMESTSIEYYIERHCNLKMVGPKLDSKDYGIAMPKNYVHKSLIDNAIVKMMQNGQLLELKKKWWKNKDNECPQDDEDDSGSLQMKNTSGIFLVLGAGGFLGLIVAIIDFLLHAHKICVTEKVTFREAIMSEWFSSFNPRTTHKPAAPPREPEPSVHSDTPRERSQSRAVSVLRAAQSFINFDEIY